MISSLNILGNAILIYALRTTGQTNTVSFKFIIIMSISDITCGVVGLVPVTQLLWEHSHGYCYLKICTQWVLNAQGSFSIMMIALIACDHYLHMTNLTRYHSIMNTRRGYCLAFNTLFFAGSMATVYQLLLHYHKGPGLILQVISAVFGVFTLGIAMALYLKAYKNLQSKAATQTNQVARSILNEARKFSKTARLIVISAIFLTMPRMVATVFEVINTYTTFLNQSSLDTFVWLGLLIYSANAFSSSVIFIMYNSLVKQFLKTLGTRSRVGSNVDDVN